MQNHISPLANSADFTSEVLLRLNMSLLSARDFPQNLTKALRIIGENSRHDRVQIIEINGNMTYTISSEWHHPSLDAVPEKLKHDTIVYHQLWEQQLNEQNHIAIYESAPDNHPAIQEMLKTESCRQMLLLPLFGSDSQFAFLAFMQCQETHEWDPGEIRLLSNLASLIALQIDNHRLINRMQHHLKKVRKAQEPMEILHTRLQHLHAEMLPIWEKFKNCLSESGISEQFPDLHNLEHHLTSFDKICRTIPVK